MSQVLITGSNGFIGRAAFEQLEFFGHNVRRCVRHLEKGSIRQNVDLIAIGDIGPDTDWSSALIDIDIVLHLAAIAHVPNKTNQELSDAFHRVNTEGTLQLAHHAIQAGVKRFIYISSIGVNGAQTKTRPFSDKDMAAPCSAYAKSKWEAEVGLMKFAKYSNLDVVIIRPPLVYGPGAPGNFFSLMRWLDRQIPLPLGAINNLRSLVGIDNLINLINTCINHSAAANQVFLVSDDEDISTTDLLQRMGLALGKPTRLIPVPTSLLQIGTQIFGKKELAQKLLGNLQVDILKTKKLLGWSPPVSLDEGLEQSAEWYMSLR